MYVCMYSPGKLREEGCGLSKNVDGSIKPRNINYAARFEHTNIIFCIISKQQWLTKCWFYDWFWTIFTNTIYLFLIVFKKVDLIECSLNNSIIKITTDCGLSLRFFEWIDVRKICLLLLKIFSFSPQSVAGWPWP